MAYNFLGTYKVNAKNVLGNTLSKYWFGLDVYTEQSNAVNNYSNVKVIAWVQMDAGNSTTSSSTYHFKKDGSTYQSIYIKLGVKDTAGYAVPYHANETVFTVYHDADGTKSITLNFSVETEYTQGANANLNNGCFKSASITQTITLPTINRLSPFSFSGSFTMGSGKDIKISPYVSSFRHNIEVHFGSYKEVVASNIETSYTWTPSKDLGHQIPNSTSGVGTIYVHTYNSGTYIGTSTKTFTLWVSGDMYPTFTYTYGQNEDFNGLLLTTMSSVNFEIQNATGSYGSTIKSYSITGEGLNVNSANGTSSVFQNNGSFTYTLKITDSRNRTATQTKSINVYKYAKPTVTLNVVRCDQYDKPSDTGNYALVSLAYNISNPNYANKNAKQIVIEYKKSNEEYWDTFYSGELGDYASTEDYTNPNIIFDSAYSYDFKATISDTFNATENTGFIATSTCILDIEPLGVGIGKYHQQGALDIKGDFYLNDKKFYESGTFNPSFYCGDGTSMVFNRREATYQKVGEYCTFNISLQVEYFNIGDTTAQLEVIDLPFVNQGTYSAVNIGYCKGISFTGNVYDLRCYIRPQESKIVFTITDLTTGNVGTIKGSHCASLLDIQFSGSYKVE
jgi:hypothetical protein